MITVITQQGKRVEIIFQAELCDPLNVGEYVRAYCHIHGSDHQRSLSVNKMTGWGHCFNAACDAIVLVAEWNPALAKHLLRTCYQGLSFPSTQSYQSPRKKSFFKYEPRPELHRFSKSPPKWQQDELATLLHLNKQMCSALEQSQRMKAYLNERGIALEVARATGVCYLPPTMLNTPAVRNKRSVLRRWADRIIFPLASPAGKGYIGRSLWHWQPGMDENAHKSLLDRTKSPRRWIKTNPAGWFGYEPEQLAECIILVEGAFDRLTLLSAGFKAAEVVALAGTAAPADWLPSQVRGVLLALDADEGGHDASHRLAERLARPGLTISICPPLYDTWGKDWNERWRRIGPQSMWPIFDAYAGVVRSVESSFSGLYTQSALWG